MFLFVFFIACALPALAAPLLHIFNEDGSGSDVIDINFEHSVEFGPRFNKIFPKTLCVLNDEKWQCFSDTEATRWITNYTVVTDQSNNFILKAKIVHAKRDVLREMVNLMYRVLRGGLLSIEQEVFEEDYPIFSSQFPYSAQSFYRSVYLLKKELQIDEVDVNEENEIEHLNDFLNLYRTLMLHGTDIITPGFGEQFPSIQEVFGDEFFDLLLNVAKVFRETSQNYN